MNRGRPAPLEEGVAHGPAGTDLLARFQSGDRAAMTELVGTMGPRLKGYFLRLGAQETTAEDLTQDVFMRVLQGIERYQEAGRLDAFLLRIARNLWIDHKRRQRFALVADDRAAEPAADQAGPEEQAERRDRTARMRAALAACDAATRELLELAIFQSLPYQEIGALLNVPVGTVKSRVFYALRGLRQRLQLLEVGLEAPAAAGRRAL